MRVKSGYWLSSLANNPSEVLFLLFLFLLPSQLGKHFWPPYAFINGLRVDYLSPTLYLSDILVLLLFLEMLPILLRLVKIKILIPVLLALLYLATVSLLSAWPISSLFGVVRVGEMVLVGWLITRFVSKSKLFTKSTIVLSVSLVGESILAIWQFFLQHSVGGLWYWFGERSFSLVTPGIANANLSGNLVLRPYGTFPHPNVLGGFCVILVCFLLYFSSHASQKSARLLVRAAILCGVFTTIISMSRTAMLVLTFVLAVWFLQRMHKGFKQNLPFLFAGAILLGVVTFSGIFVRFSAMRISDEAVVVRELLFMQAVQLFENNQLVGVGVSNFLPNLALQVDPLLSYRNLQPAHSLYLLILAETGIVGALIFLSGIIFCSYRIWQSKVYRLGKVMLVLSLLLLGLTDHYLYTLHQGQLLVGFVFGIAVSSFQGVSFTVPRAKNLRMSGQRKHVKKGVSSSSLKISRIRIARRKKIKRTLV